MALIPFEDLERANKRYLSEQVRKEYESTQSQIAEDSVPEGRFYVYKPRTAEQWGVRIRQRRRDSKRHVKKRS